MRVMLGALHPLDVGQLARGAGACLEAAQHRELVRRQRASVLSNRTRREMRMQARRSSLASATSSALEQLGDGVLGSQAVDPRKYSLVDT